MRVLLVGSGGREHALAWKLAQSPRVTALFVAPGNGGTDGIELSAGGTSQNIPLAANDLAGIVDFAAAYDVEGLLGHARAARMDLVVVGPEGPLAQGLADSLRAAGIATFGPSASAARLESSKAFSKDFMARHGIPTARYATFTDAAKAKAFLDTLTPPYVIKADGLAAGKGVVIPQTRAEAEAEIDAMLGGRFGAASETLVIEEFMIGEEASFFALLDGETAVPLIAAQDHKRAFDGDEGPNTGGMGAYSPTPAFTDADAALVMETVVRPTAKGMVADGHPFQGVLFVGLMMTGQGPRVIEYNVRFGDPECQVIMTRMTSDLAETLHAAATGRLAASRLTWDPRPAVTVVMASRGYPGSHKPGSIIRGVERADELPGVKVFVAGARRQDGALIAEGGRVLNVTAIGDTVEDAVVRAYAGVGAIDWPEGFHRRDIAHRALKREAKT